MGTGAGVGAGVFLRPATDLAEDAEMTKEETEAAEKDATSEEKKSSVGKEYIKLSNQFVVPIVEKDRIASMVVMTLSVEVPEGRGEDVYDLEPKIRDVFLRVLFDHAAIGGFAGAFLNNDNLDVVRTDLGNAASTDFGSEFISDVLIFEIARQDY
jgi:hypothetical protein